MKQFEELFSKEELHLLRCAIADVLDVSTYHKYNNYIKENESNLSKISENILSYIKSKKFFEEWNIYDENTKLNESEIKLLIKVVDIVLEIHTDDEFSTYVYYEKDIATSVKKRLENILINLQE